jgi:hypothetical protein
MDLEISGEIRFWKGPAPYSFVTVPDEESRKAEGLALGETVTVRLGIFIGE